MHNAVTFGYPRVGASCDCLLAMALDTHCLSSAGLILNAHPVIATLDPTRDETPAVHPRSMRTVRAAEATQPSIELVRRVN